jgi:hypothetical protein
MSDPDTTEVTGERAVFDLQFAFRNRPFQESANLTFSLASRAKCWFAQPRLACQKDAPDISWQLYQQ